MRKFTWLGSQNIVYFGGTDGWRRVYGRQAFPVSGPFTVSVTFCATPQAGYAEMLSVDGSTPFYLGRTPQGTIRAGDAWSDTGVPFPSDGGWHCLTLVRQDNATILYLDGYEVKRLGQAIPNPNGTDLRIGCQYGEHGEYFRGWIAEVVVFSLALNATQVQDYAGGLLVGEEPGLCTLVRCDLEEAIERVSGMWCSGAGDFRFLPANPPIASYQDPPPAPGPALPVGTKLFEASKVCEFFLKPEVPENLSQFSIDGFWAGFIPIIGTVTAPIAPWGPIVAGLQASGVMSPEAKERISKLTFRRSEKQAGISCRADVTVLRRSDGRFDFVLKLGCSAITCYTGNGDQDPMLRSLYQDELRVHVSPSMAARDDLVIEHSAVRPRTNNETVSYAETVGWSASVGFEGRTPSGSIGFSANSSTATAYQDFMVNQRTVSGQDQIEWVSGMKNVYRLDGKVEGRIYQTPDDMVSRTPYTNWLLVPPNLAQNDLYQEYIAAYSSQGPELRERKVAFQVRIVQRLQHAETVGRWGLIKAGGVSLVVPYAIVATINCIVDLQRGQVDIQPLPVRGMNAHEIFRA